MVTAQVDPTGTGDSFVDAQVIQNGERVRPPGGMNVYLLTTYIPFA